MKRRKLLEQLQLVETYLEDGAPRSALGILQGLISDIVKEGNTP